MLDQPMTLSAVTRTQGHTAALKDGTLKPAGFEFQFIDVPQLIDAFRRMVRGLEFDVSEMAITTYLCAREHGKALIALPIFLVRAFHHGAILCNPTHGIRAPGGLAGTRVGVNRGYTVTTGVWARSVLQEEHGVDLSQVRGTGSEGRVTRKDILDFIGKEPSVTPASPRGGPQPSGPAVEDQIIPISHLRRTIAENMVRSKQTAPHVTQIHEVDVTKIAGYREANKEAFFERTGINLTFLPFVVKATVDALQAHPLLNASYADEGIVVRKAVNIGLAVALEDGLIVPVLRDADKKNFLTLAKESAHLAARAREKRLNPEEVQKGTFTVNNLGAFGALIGTPIIVQPQVGILGFGRVVKRPVVIDDTIAIRSMAYLCLSYDHRLIDGAYAGAFLNRVQANLEGFDVSVVE